MVSPESNPPEKEVSMLKERLTAEIEELLRDVKELQKRYKETQRKERLL